MIFVDRWFKLDNAAKFYSSVVSASDSYVFRNSAVLYEPVDKDNLQKSVDLVRSRYPILFVRMRRGVFWNYLDSNDESFVVEEEKSYPCSRINPVINNGYFLKVLFYGNRISVEIFHSLTDGIGAFEFLKSLLYYYFLFSGFELDSEGKILLSDGYVPLDNLEDSFSVYYDKMKLNLKKSPNAYRISGTPFSNRGNRVTTGVLSASELNRVAKTKNVSITVYLTAVLIYSIFMTRHVHRKMKPIVIGIPVNLRNEFPSTTLRNFFILVNVGMKVTKETKFEEIIEIVSKELKEKTTKEALKYDIFKFVWIEKSIAGKFIPLRIKKAIVNASYRLRSENKKTITFSNLGKVSLPQSMNSLISHMEAVIYLTKKSPINVSICSVNDRLSISFSRWIEEKELPCYFFRFIAKQSGVDVSVYSNE